MEYDVFISHASEDKEEVARPLARLLMQMGARVWLDEFELCLGDSLRKSIDKGLSQSKFGVVILSHKFFSKDWPQRELNGLAARESENQKVILPIWHNITKEDVTKFSPMLADKLAASTAIGLEQIAQDVFRAIKRTGVNPEPDALIFTPSPTPPRENRSVTFLQWMTRGLLVGLISGICLGPAWAVFFEDIKMPLFNAILMGVIFGPLYGAIAVIVVWSLYKLFKYAWRRS